MTLLHELQEDMAAAGLPVTELRIAYRGNPTDHRIETSRALTVGEEAQAQALLAAWLLQSPDERRRARKSARRAQLESELAQVVDTVDTADLQTLRGILKKVVQHLT